MTTRLTGTVRLGSREARNRVLFGPHETNLGRRRGISERHVAYYARRAEGGTGLVVTEIASVHPSDWPYERAPLAADCGPGWRDVATACHPHGTLVLAGLGHAGMQGSSAFSQHVLWGASRVPDPGTREIPMEMEEPELDAVVAGFADAAGLAVWSELDGVEVNAGQHSLLRQFHSGLTNQRSDVYGKDKLKLTKRVLKAVRERIGDGALLGLRLCCDELAPWAGVTQDAAAEQAVLLGAPLDYLVVVRGSIFSVPATRPDLHTEPGFNIDLCRDIRTAVTAALDTPPLVVLQGSVVDPGQAQLALDDGVCDLVEMTRAQIAEPDLVELVRTGQSEHARTCVLCNQNCMVRDNRNPIVSSILEPRSGHETQDPPPQGDDPGSVRALVVGGGPAGLEAARVLASRGHEVKLVERERDLGGMLRLAAGVHGRARLGEAIRWWKAELDRLGVRVTLDTEITAAELDTAERDGTSVLLATGSVPGPHGYQVAEGAHVLDAAELLSLMDHDGLDGLDQLPGGAVVVFDPIGGPAGVGIAELLADAGRRTALVSQDQIAGTQLALTGDLAEANGRLQRAGVARELRSLLREVTKEHVVLEDCWTAQRREVTAAVVIHCGHRLPDERLYLQRPGTARAGDCVAPRTVAEAVREGRAAALEIAGRHGHPRRAIATPAGAR